MKNATVTAAALRLLKLLDSYSRPPTGELALDLALLAFLEGRVRHMSRQHRVYIANSNRPKRIDFRHGGPNPTVIEFAVRPPTGGSQLHGRQNTPEIRKLTRVPQSQAKRRVLLLMDCYRDPLARPGLKASYDAVTTGAGNFKRHSVRVLYVHSSSQFNFLWRP